MQDDKIKDLSAAIDALWAVSYCGAGYTRFNFDVAPLKQTAQGGLRQALRGESNRWILVGVFTSCDDAMAFCDLIEDYQQEHIPEIVESRRFEPYERAIGYYKDDDSPTRPPSELE